MHLPGILVSTDWLGAHLNAPELRILDATTRTVADSSGQTRSQPDRAGFDAAHIPGAVFIDVQGDLSDRASHLHYMLPDRQAFVAAMGRLGIGDATRVVVYSAANVWWATRVWLVLRAYGVDAVAVLDGGFAAWQREGRPVESGPGRSLAAGPFTARPPRPCTVGKDAVVDALASGAARVLNALSGPQHRGEVASIKDRPGHIAGSVNLPAADLLDRQTGRFLPAPALAARFAAVGAANVPVISYCGGGITASALVFARALIGRDDAQVYDASLEEWAADPALPMSTG